MRIDKYLTGLLILAALGSSLISGSVSAKEYFTVKNNVLERPTGFREWVYVGTPLTPNDGLNPIKVRNYQWDFSGSVLGRLFQ